MLRFTDIALGEGGRCGCRRCHGSGDETLRERSEIVADIAEAVRTSEVRPGPNISLTGAEPFHHPDLIAIVTAAVDAGVERVRLESDAEALGSAATAQAAVAAGVRHLRFPLLGSSAASHDTLACSPGAFEATRAGVKAFADAARAAGVAVQVSACGPVCRHNLADVPGMVKAAVEMDARLVLLRIEDTGLALPDAALWLRAACDTGIVNSAWVEVEGMPIGQARGWELHLASLYRTVEGAKADCCDACALVSSCQGAVTGASPAVLSVFRPPDDAAAMAAAIARGSADPCHGGPR